MVAREVARTGRRTRAGFSGGNGIQFCAHPGELLIADRTLFDLLVANRV